MTLKTAKMADIISQNPSKRQKINDSIAQPLPTSLIAVFTSQDGERTDFPPIELPIGSTTKQLEALVNSLMGNSDVVK